MPPYLIGLDAGSSSVRALVVDVESGRTTVAVRKWKHPRAPEGDWAYDFDTDRNWALITEAVQETLQKAGVSPDEVAGIAATSMRHSLVLMRGGEVLLALPNQDARAAGESMEMADAHGAALLPRTGRWPSPIFMAPRLKWVAAHHPKWLEGTVAVSISDWVAFRLCGEQATDYSQAAESMLLDIGQRVWMEDLLADLGLPRSLLPPLRPSGARLGALTPSVAADLGLSPGIPVAVGGADTQCALLGLGVTEPGDLGIVAGTTAPLQAVADRPATDPDGRLWTGLHVLPDRWVLESNGGPLGEPLEWLAHLLFPDSPHPVARLIAEAAHSRPGAGGILSTFSGQVFNARAMELPVGHIALSHLLDGDGPARRADFCRAVLEGMAFIIRANLEQITAVLGEPPTVAMTGGLTRSSFWTRLVADVLGRPVRVSDFPECTALGAAICAGVGAGVFADLPEGARRLSRTCEVQPDEPAGQTYAALYTDWQRLRAAQAEARDIAADRMLSAIMERPATVRAPALHFRPRFLVTAQMDEASLAELRRLGDVEYANYRESLRILTGDDLVEALQGVHVFITEMDVVDEEVLRQVPDLRVVASCRGQAVNVDLDACTAQGIPVLNAPGRNADAVADLTVAFMLALARKLMPANQFLRQPGGEAGDMGRMGHAYSEFLGHELWGKTVGLVGLGAVGRRVARRLIPFGVRLLVYDPYLRPEDAGQYDAELVSLDRLLAESDFVSLHAPVTDETRGLIGREAIARMKRGAFLINTARAALLDEEALAEALRSGHLAGAALDVFAVEPPAWDHPLLTLPNVIATPHIGGNTAEVAAHQGQMVVEDVRRMLAGERPRYVLNPETLENFSWTGPRRPPEGVTEVRPTRPAPAITDLQQEMAMPSVSREEPVMTSAVPASDLRTRMEEILRRFCEKAVTDPALVAFAAKRRVFSHYTVTDLGLEFYVGFQDGQVLAGLGASPAPAEVRMKATAAVLHEILTGRLSGNKAAMSGKLSFSGDVRTAMGLQRIQGDMVRLYTAAKEEMGGIDFAAAAAPSPAAPVPSAPPMPVGAEDPRLEMVRAVGELYALQLITATGGNVSVRIEGRDECWITPSQLYKGGLQPEMMVRIDFEGHILEGALAPSSEWALHTEIYKARPEIGAVVHTHAPYATILGLSRLPFLPVTTEAAFLKELPVTPFVMPGTKELARAAVAAMGKNPACILQNHGLVVAATSLRRACNLTEVIERTAQLIWSCYAVGRKPPTLPREVLKTLRELGEMMA